MYHLTDLPSFVSDDRLVFFDPHATHLPVSAANPGSGAPVGTQAQELITLAGKMLRLQGNPALSQEVRSYCAGMIGQADVIFDEISRFGAVNRSAVDADHATRITAIPDPGKR